MPSSLRARYSFCTHIGRGVPRSITQIQTSYVRIGYIRECFTIPNNYASHYILISMVRPAPPDSIGFINVVYEELIKFEYY